MSLSTNTTYRVFLEKLGGSDPDQFVGDQGELFYDPSSTSLYISDGSTPGGVPLGVNGIVDLNEAIFLKLPDFLEFNSQTPLQVGSDSKGLFFAYADAGDADVSYPIRTNFSIDGTTKVTITVDVSVNQSCADFGLCVFEEGQNPEWEWGSNNTRIAAQYDCPNPYINGLVGSIGTSWGLSYPEEYRVRFTYDPNNTPNVKFETLDTSNNVLNTITLDETLNTGVNYKIGFAADQDDYTELRTYIKNLIIAVDGGNTYMNDLLAPLFPSEGVWDANNFGVVRTTAFVGIGTIKPQYKLDVQNGDARVGMSTSQGLILTAPNGTKYRLFVDNSGVVSSSAV